MIKHLKDKNIGYWEHWLIATKCGIALLIHAWLPFILEDYASKNICKKDYTYPEFIKKFYKND